MAHGLQSSLPALVDRRNASKTWNHARKEECRICTRTRWLCLAPHCGHIAEQGLGVKIYISNVAKHLLETHGIDSSNSLWQQVSSSTSLKQVTLTDSRLLCPLLHTIDPLHEGKLLLLRCIIQNAWAFNHMDSDSWIALSSYYSRPAWCSTTMKSFVVQRATQLRQEFVNKVLPFAPGVSVTVDEWSDRQCCKTVLGSRDFCVCRAIVLICWTDSDRPTEQNAPGSF